MCQKCGYVFSQKSHLTRHNNTVHLKIKQYQCEICGKRFAQGHHKTQHMNVHYKQIELLQNDWMKNVYVMHKIALAYSKYCNMDFSTLRWRQNGRQFTDDTFRCIFLIENIWISINISLNFVPKGWINNIPSLVQIMAWCQPGNKPLSEPMMVSLVSWS